MGRRYRIPFTLASVNAVHVEGFAKPASIDPGDEVPDVKACILDPHIHAVLRARPGERQQMPAGLKHAQALGPDLDGRDVVIPTLAHE